VGEVIRNRDAGIPGPISLTRRCRSRAVRSASYCC